MYSTPGKKKIVFSLNGRRKKRDSGHPIYKKKKKGGGEKEERYSFAADAECISPTRGGRKRETRGILRGKKRRAALPLAVQASGEVPRGGGRTAPSPSRVRRQRREKKE